MWKRGEKIVFFQGADIVGMEVVRRIMRDFDFSLWERLNAAYEENEDGKDHD